MKTGRGVAAGGGEGRKEGKRLGGLIFERMGVGWG